MLVVIPMSFAAENTDDNITLASGHDDVLSDDCYFDAGSDEDGNGSADNPYKNLNQSMVKDNSINHFKDGEYTLNGQVFKRNVTVIGNDAQNTVIKYNGVGFFVSESLTLQNVTLVNLAIKDNSVCIINATNVIFKDFKTSSISTSSSNTKVYLNNCTFMNNHANSGASIYVEKGSLEIIDTLFINNNATMYGGAIYLRESEFVARNMEIINSTSKMGGAITAVYTGISITNWTARNNRATYGGGAMYALFGSFSLSNSTFINNTAKDGGALFIDEVNNFIPFNNTFKNNTADGIAGAVYSAISRNVNRTSIRNESLLNSFSDNCAEFMNDTYECEAINLDYNSQNCILIYSEPYYVANLPASYDLRDEHMVTPVKDQGSNGNCWAFAALASLESCILKANGGAYDLSEENMKNLMSKYSSYGWQMVTNTGGYDRMAHAYLTSWIGPVNDTEDRYIVGEVLSPVLDSIFHIQNILFLQRSNYTDNDLIKRAIISYGAVSTSIHWYQSADGTDYYRNGKNIYWYKEGSKANHAVAIVGWDDNYSRTNFKTTPPGDGAWIIKNSWGSSSGEGGYFYVSYYDTSLAPLNKPYSTYVFVFNDTIKYDKNYQYDVAGRTDFFINSSSTVWYKNKFTATDNEFLSAVSTYFEKDTVWELAIYVNDVLKHTQSGKATPSYSTIELNNFIPIEIGDVFEIVFKVTVDGEASFPISEDIIASGVPINKQLFYENISFVSYDGEKWTDLYNLSWKYSTHSYASQVACIKAFTVFDVINTTLNLSFEEKKGYIIKAEVTNQYDRPVNGRNVTFTLDGKEYNATLINGVAILDVPLEIGNHNVSAVFASTGYISSKDNLSFYGPLLNTEISFNINYTDPIKLTVNVADQYGVPVKYGNVTVDFDGCHYSLNLTDGSVIIEHLFNRSGAFDIAIDYNGIHCYNSSILRDSLNIPLVNTNVSLYFTEFNPINLTAAVYNQYGYKVNHGTVTFIIDGRQHNVSVINGSATWIEELDAYVLHNVSALFNAIDYLNSSQNSTKFNIKLVNTTLSIAFTKINPVQIEVTVKDANSTPVNYGNVIFTIEGANYTVNLDNGMADITHMFRTFGSQNITIYYNGFNYYVSQNQTIAIPVNTSLICGDSTKTYNSQYEFSLIDSDGIPLNASEVTVKIGSKIYKVTTDENGTAKLTIDLNPGKYEFIITNPETGEVKTPTVTVPARICENKDVTMYYGAGKYYKVKVLDDDGNIAKGVTVTFTINGKKYTKTTDANGYASLKISQKPAKYTVTAEYKGFKVSNKVTVKSTIVTKNIKVKKGKTIKFKAKLLNKNGKALKNKKLKFKFKGKTYRVKTNKKGKATLKIKKKYKKGKYTITTSYGKLKVKNTIRIK